MATAFDISNENDSLDGFSLPGWVYHDPDFFKVEMDRLVFCGMMFKVSKQPWRRDL